MLKSVAIFLSVILMSQGLFANFFELEKMDALAEHAKFHQEQYGDNLATFIDKHYGDLKDQHFKDHQEEQSDHERLPYHISTPFVNQAVFLFDQSITRLKVDFLVKSEKANFYYNQLYKSLLISDILHPPRI